MKRVRLAIIILSVALIGVIGWLVARPSEPEPVYQGRALTSWLRSYYLYDTALPQPDPQVQEAVRQIGTNAIPTLLRWLRARDSALKPWLIGLVERQHIIKVHFTRKVELKSLAIEGFEALGTNAQMAVPELLEIARQNISPSSQVGAIASIYHVGAAPAAKQAIPYLWQIYATNIDLGPRSWAEIALRRIDPEAAAKARLTLTRMQVLQRRVLRYTHSHDELPKSLAELAPIEGCDNSLQDGWDRDIVLEVSASGQVSLRSLGRHGASGTGEGTDITRSFPARDAKGRWSREKVEFSEDKRKP